jgi:hypothetical protein
MKNYLPKVQIFLSVVFLAASSFVFMYVYKQTINNNQQAEASQMEAAQVDQAKEEVRFLDNSLKAIQEEKTALENHFVPSSNAVPFLDTLAATAKSVGVKSEVTSVDLSTDHTTFAVEFTASGSFPLVYKFIKLVENLPYEIDVNSLAIERTTPSEIKGVSNPEWSADFKINVLSFIP